MTTKLEDEMNSVKKGFRGGVDRFILDLDNPFSASIMRFASRILKSVPLTWFMAGMAIEAIGLAIQFGVGMPTYPILDFAVAGVIAVVLYLYQKRTSINV